MTPVDHCAVCGEAFGHIRSDDAPPWLTILVVGHVVIPLAATIEAIATWPAWVGMTLWPTLSFVLAAAVLPRAKAVFLAAIWHTKAPGSEPV
ncbi:MAG: DUF983 domain-containing protein [Rhodospirillales bacterium]|nr:DUF983 domain-containing protein [Rhodospirillales bacterium]